MILPKLYKKTLLLVCVIGPIFWLVFTEDGIRRSDTLLLWIMGGDPIDIDFSVLDHQYRQQDWQKVYPDVQWQCQKKASAFGDHLCHAELSSYNGIPARYISVFFNKGTTHAVKLAYRPRYHAVLGQQLQQQLGAPRSVSNSPSVLQWTTENGLIVLKQQLQNEDDAALLWLARKPSINP